jgi:hypothetical protein
MDTDNNNRLLFDPQYSLIPPEQQTNISDGKYRWKEYRNSNHVNSDFLAQNDMSSLHHSLDPHPFEMMFGQQLPSSSSFPSPHAMEPGRKEFNLGIF